jgi:hypothetical protein
MFENVDTKQTYTLRITIWDDKSIADYSIDDVITWIFTDSTTGEDYNINDIITKIFTEDNQNDDMSLDQILDLVFNWEWADDIAVDEPIPEPAPAPTEDIGLDEILQKVFWDI